MFALVDLVSVSFVANSFQSSASVKYLYKSILNTDNSVKECATIGMLCLRYTHSFYLKVQGEITQVVEYVK